MGQNNDVKIADAAWNFYRLKEQYECEKQDFEFTKLAFYDMMSDYFSENNIVSAEFEDSTLSGPPLVIKKVEKTNIEWDAEKLEKKVGRSIAKQVIKKQYRISDMQGLVDYLKSCGVDPKVFKKFIVVDKTVDAAAVDRLGDTGQLSVNQIAGCYTVKANKPYYTAKLKK